MSSASPALLSQLTVASPVGELRLVATPAALVALHLPVHSDPEVTGAQTVASGAHALLDAAAAELAEYFAGKRTTFTVPLAPAGTEFQQAVWRALVAIPFGERTSYGQIAAQVGRPQASRAVGAANGQNPIAIIVPCHRVVGADGSMTGYGGGLPTKRWLLAHESAVLDAGQPGFALR